MKVIQILIAGILVKMVVVHNFVFEMKEGAAQNVIVVVHRSTILNLTL